MGAISPDRTMTDPSFLAMIHPCMWYLVHPRCVSHSYCAICVLPSLPASAIAVERVFLEGWDTISLHHTSLKAETIRTPHAGQKEVALGTRMYNVCTLHLEYNLFTDFKTKMTHYPFTAVKSPIPIQLGMYRRQCTWWVALQRLRITNVLEETKQQKGKPEAHLESHRQPWGRAKL